MTFAQQVKLHKARQVVDNAYKAWQADTSGKESNQNKTLWSKWLDAVKKQEKLMNKFY